MKIKLMTIHIKMKNTINLFLSTSLQENYRESSGGFSNKLYGLFGAEKVKKHRGSNLPKFFEQVFEQEQPQCKIICLRVMESKPDLVILSLSYAGATSRSGRSIPLQNESRNGDGSTDRSSMEV